MNTTTAEPRSTPRARLPCIQAFDLLAESREPIRRRVVRPESLVVFARELAACAVTLKGLGGPTAYRAAFEENGFVLRACVRRLARMDPTPSAAHRRRRMAAGQLVRAGRSPARGTPRTRAALLP